MEKLNGAKVRKFLGSLNDVEFRYMRIQTNMASEARQLVFDFKLTREQFCENMQISPRQYNSYMNGGFNYDLRKMCLMQSYYCKLSAERAALAAAENAKVKFTHVNPDL